MSERKERTKLGLSKYVAEAAERGAESDGDLALSRNVRGIVDVHSTLWPVEQQQGTILNLAVLTGQIKPLPIDEVEPKALPDTER